jgi:hypothetical protein
MVATDSDTLNGLIDVVPVVPISSNHAAYLNYIEADLQKGSLTAGFTRGEASKATATEVSALMQYTASELGKMARDRDSTLESAALLYVRMLLPLIDDSEKVVISTPNGADVVTVDKLDADWTFYATDGGSTPMTDLLKKQQLVGLVPILAQLGVPGSALKDEIIRLYGLPPSFAEEAPPAPAPSSPAPGGAPETEASVSDVIGGV